METQAITGTYVLYEHTFPVKGLGFRIVASLMPPGDDEFDRGPHPEHQEATTGYDRDFARAQADRASTNGLVSIAYWIVRAVQGLFGLISRRR
jgi:hypothetical protein